MHRHLGMGMAAEELRAFHANGPVAKRGAFGGAGGDSNVSRHGGHYQAGESCVRRGKGGKAKAIATAPMPSAKEPM